MDHLPELLEQLIKIKTKEKGITIGELAEKMNSSQSTLYRIYTRQRGISQDMADHLNRFFEVSDFKAYKINKETNKAEPWVTVKKCTKANMFKVGEQVLDLQSKQIKTVSEVRFNKAFQEWIYKFEGEAGLTGERYLKKINEKPEPTFEQELLEHKEPKEPIKIVKIPTPKKEEPDTKQALKDLLAYMYKTLLDLL